MREKGTVKWFNAARGLRIYPARTATGREPGVRDDGGAEGSSGIERFRRRLTSGCAWGGLDFARSSPSLRMDVHLHH